MLKIPTIFIVLLTLLIEGCSSESISVLLRPPVPKMHAGTFRAGARCVDITPPPGYPMGGYGIAGRYSRGFWSRLYANAIYLEDSSGTNLTFVVCDLWSMPAGLADRVAEIVRDSCPHIGRENIIVSAIHTHNSPGNFSSSPVFNMLASPGMGFDASLFQFLAFRIASSVIDASRSAKDAKITMGTSSVRNMIRNRSMDAFEANPDSEKESIKRAVLPYEHPLNEHVPLHVMSPDAFRAVNESLTVFRIDPVAASERSPIAVAAFYAVHPTVMGTATEVYSSDIFGVARKYVENAMQDNSSSTSPVIALFNGAEGDISANWERQDRANTLRLGTMLGNAILSTSQSAHDEVSGRIRFRYEWTKIAGSEAMDLYHDTCGSISGSMLTAASRPLPGTAVFGGAEDGRTIFYNVGLREGAKLESMSGDQADKQSAIEALLMDFLHLKSSGMKSYLQKTIEPVLTTNAPESVPIGVYSVGSIILATLPGECTVTEGARMKNSIRQSVGNDKSILLIGLANEYLSYFTTPCEYYVQDYEGASNMYGPATGPLLESALRKISSHLDNKRLPEYSASYEAGSAEEFGLKDFEQPQYWKMDEALQNVLVDPENGTYLRHLPQFEWSEPIPALDAGRSVSVHVTPSVAIEESTATGWKPLTYSVGGMTITESDKQSLDFVSVVPYVAKGSVHWNTHWLVPAGVDKTKFIRFSITTSSGIPIHSHTFKPVDILSGDGREVIPASEQ